MMKASERLRVLDAEIQVYPTSRGWTVRASYWIYRFGRSNKMIQKKWTGIPDYTEHGQSYTFAELNHKMQEAVAWLDSESRRFQ